MKQQKQTYTEWLNEFIHEYGKQAGISLDDATRIIESGSDWEDYYNQGLTPAQAVKDDFYYAK